jgi:uncharacterized protein YecT (DUF1311 family)
MLLRMKKLLLASALLSVSAAQVAAQLLAPDTEAKAKCAKYLQTPMPPEASYVAVPTDFPLCDSMALFYGTWKTDPNFQAAAACAWQERAFNLSEKGKPPDDPNTPIPFSQIYGGSAILVNIYADGLSVQRNVPLALRFACEADRYEFPGDLDGAIKALEDLSNKPAPRSKKDYFKMCDFQGSTPTAAVCALWDEEAANDNRNQAIKALTRKWSRTQFSALSQLRNAAELYYHEHAGNELSTAGTARAVEAVEELGTFRDTFQASLCSFEKGNVPKASSADFTKSDALLNRVYRLAIAYAERHKTEYGAIQPEGIRDAERSWLKYRDAWVDFAQLRYPNVSADSWRTMLTNDRIAVVKDIACETGFDDLPCDLH